jgi:hypothetical protein
MIGRALMRSYLLLVMVLTAAAGPAAAAPSSGAAAAPAGGTVTFQVLDETAQQEVSEDTVIFIDGKLVAHFVLDKHETSSIADVTVPSAAQYDYALCGRITVLRPDGQEEQRVVDGGATLKNVNGKVFLALEAADFTIFYLADAKQDPQDPPKDVHHTNACSLPVS